MDLYSNKGVESKCILATSLSTVMGNWSPSLRKEREFLHGILNSQTSCFNNTFQRAQILPVLFGTA